MTMLEWLTTIAVCTCRLNCETSSSIPTANMKRQTPIWLKSRSGSKGGRSEKEMESIRRQEPEEGWAEQDASDHFAHHGWLPNADEKSAGERRPRR